VQIFVALVAVMLGRLMLGKVISAVGRAAFSIDNELSLANAVADPIETHIHRLGSFLLDAIVGYSRGGRIVGHDRCRWLGMAEFVQGDPFGHGFFAVVEESTQFGLGGAG
jgi:hypothetical protein